jgi:hypothetical protein
MLFALAALLAVEASATRLGSWTTGLALSPSGNILVQAQSDTSLRIIDLGRLYEPFRTAWLTAFSFKEQHGAIHNVRFRSDGAALLALVDNDQRSDSVSTLHVMETRQWGDIDTSVREAVAAEFVDDQRALVLKRDSILLWNYVTAEVEASLPVRKGTALAVDPSGVAWIGSEDGAVVRWQPGAESSDVIKQTDAAVFGVFRISSVLITVTDAAVTLWDIDPQNQATSRQTWKRDDTIAGPFPGADSALYMLHRNGATAELCEIAGGRKFMIYLPADAWLDVPMLIDAARQRLFSGNDIDRKSFGAAETIIYDLTSGLPIAQSGWEPTFTSLGETRCTPGDGARIPADLLESIADTVVPMSFLPTLEKTLVAFSAKRDLDRRSVAKLLARMRPSLRAPLEVIASYDPGLFARSVEGFTTDDWKDEQRRMIENLLDRAAAAQREKVRGSLAAVIAEELLALTTDLRLAQCALANKPLQRKRCIVWVKRLVVQEPDSYHAAWTLIELYIAARRAHDGRRAVKAFNDRFSFDTDDPPPCGCADDFLDRAVGFLDSLDPP